MHLLSLFILNGVNVILFLVCFVFFFKQKTAYEMRISDWSSDVCSSDLSLWPQAARLSPSNRIAECRKFILQPENGKENIAAETLDERRTGTRSGSISSG